MAHDAKNIEGALINGSRLSIKDTIVWFLRTILLIESDKICLQIPELCFSVPLTSEDYLEYDEIIRFRE